MLERPGAPYVLPTLGLPYGSEIPGGEVLAFSMRTTEVRLFQTTQKKLDIENAIDQVIKRCTDVKLPPEKLTIGDRTFLFIKIRCVSYGTKFPFDTTCTNCNQKHPWTMDLEKDLEVKYVDPATYKDIVPCTLPYSKDVVNTRLLLGEDERRIIKLTDKAIQNSKNAANLGDASFSYRLASYITSVESSYPERVIKEDTPNKFLSSVQYVEELDAKDLSELERAVNEMTPGLILRVQVTCPSCQDEHYIALPYNTEFFRSTPV